MEEQQRKRFERAVERKNEEARAASEQTAVQNAREPDVTGEIQPDMIAANTHQDTMDARAKNTGHGKRTADKWNQ
jgi:hypothetical protein